MGIGIFKKNKKVVKGFTLIELLVGIVIIVTSASAIVILLTSVFRVSNKSNSLEAVRASGNNAVNFMQRTIQFADGFSAASNDSTFTTYVSSCPTTATPYGYIRVRSGSGTKEFSCTGGHLYYDSGTGDSDLVDISKVDITSCQLTCSQASSSTPPVVGISFDLSLKSSNSLPEKNASISFSTIAKMRNL